MQKINSYNKIKESTFFICLDVMRYDLILFID